MINLQSGFLKEMGITEWTSRESIALSSQDPQAIQTPRFFWWFIGDPIHGDAKTLFQNIIRILGLGAQEWSWIKTSENLSTVINSNRGLPAVAFVFGGSTAQKITGERDPITQLRETVLTINTDGLEDIPVVATFDLSYFLSKPKDKSLLWQDLLLAKSVLQSL
jgi:uracil-DNA glycosylase